jgi:hypothetical protein
MRHRVAAAPADDARARIDGQSGIIPHQFRRAGVMNVIAVKLRNARIPLGDHDHVRIGSSHREHRDQKV